jgi:hypothetical protein
MYITFIYIIYLNINIPGPCIFHVPFHLDSAAALALFPTQRESRAQPECQVLIPVKVTLSHVVAVKFALRNGCRDSLV